MSEALSTASAPTFSATTTPTFTSATITTLASTTATAATVTASSYVAVPAGTAAAPSVRFSSDTDSGLYSAGANVLGTTVAGTACLHIAAAAVYPEDDVNGAYDLGIVTTNEFQDLFIVNAPTVSSDRRLKKDITENNLGLNFIMDLKPVSYKWKPGTTDDQKTLQFGFIAQDVDETLRKYGYQENSTRIAYRHIKTKPTEDGLPDKWTMTYAQLMAPAVSAIQQLSNKVDICIEEIARLGNRILDLESKLQNMGGGLLIVNPETVEI